MGLGDVVEKATTAVGIKPCGGCRKAKPLLNSSNPRDVLKGLAMIPGNAVAIARGKAEVVPMQGKMTPEAKAYFEGADEILEHVVKTYPSALSPEQQKEVRDFIQTLKDQHQ